MNFEVTDALIRPRGQMDSLSQIEVAHMLNTSQGELAQLFRNCSLAVLNCDSGIDDGKLLLERYPDFCVDVISQPRGIKLELKNAPDVAFVDGELLAGINEQLFAVLRDVIYVHDKIVNSPHFDLTSSDDITNAVFHILRNAQVIIPGRHPNMVVCWGGHSIGRDEYEYTKEVGYQLGLRNMDICTGCGAGAMKGPMKGATIGHAKQRNYRGRYLGLTEPGIIAAESPNPIVNELVILPDIEKRLEAFARVGHGFIVFPGGAGTMEEILYILGVLLHPDNADMPFPLIFTGPASAKEYFERIDGFLLATLGEVARKRYRIIIDDPVGVALAMKGGMREVREFRIRENDAYHYNWFLKVEQQFQQPFLVNHDSMAALQLTRDQDCHDLAANLRRAFSGVVTGNVKEEGIRQIEKHGLFELHGDAGIMEPMDELLEAFVAQQRMKLPGFAYEPCYRIVK